MTTNTPTTSPPMSPKVGVPEVAGPTAVPASEGTLAQAIERQTAKIPSDFFLWAAGGCILGFLTYQLFNRKHTALFIGEWVPSLLLLGIYNKLVKQLGSDRADNLR